MSRKKRETMTAERAIKRAIEEETASLQSELRQANARIARLENVLANISGIARNAIGEIAEEVPASPPAPRAELVPIPTGPAAELAGADNLGDGRWV